MEITKTLQITPEESRVLFVSICAAITTNQTIVHGLRKALELGEYGEFERSDYLKRVFNFESELAHMRSLLAKA